MTAELRIPVLCYHSQIVTGADYADNGHMALASDLEMITDAGKRIVPLHWLGEWLDGQRDTNSLKDAVAISFDDGLLSDYQTVSHPEHGDLPGFLPLLEDFHNGPRGHQQPDLHATSFVIVSPQAQDDLDQRCHGNIGWQGCAAWAAADSHPLLAVENHSWDHNHETCSEAPGNRQGNFLAIDSFRLCQQEVRRASEELTRVLGRRPRLFAYPYGEYSDYLSREYLPRYGAELGLIAAFTTAGDYVRQSHNRWLLPRFVHGWHWRSPQVLADLLSAA
ncbi:MAG: hypothetical protein Tsb002_07930 [Wenzhouxiangellaceae bacterium]